VEELEHGDTPPYDVLRKLFKTFGIDQINLARYQRRLAQQKNGAAEPDADEEGGDRPGSGDGAAMQLIPIIEICRYSPGMVTALGVSVGLTSRAIMSTGTVAQMERWVPPILTLEKIGAW